MSMLKGERSDDLLSHSSPRSLEASDIIHSQLSPLHSSGRAMSAKSRSSSSSALVNTQFGSTKIDVPFTSSKIKLSDKNTSQIHRNDNNVSNTVNVKPLMNKVESTKVKEEQRSVVSVSLNAINVGMTVNTESFFSSSTSSAASSSSSSPSKSSALSSSSTSSDEWGGFSQSFKIALHNDEFNLATSSSTTNIFSKQSGNTTFTNNNNNNNNNKTISNRDKGVTNVEETGETVVKTHSCCIDACVKRRERANAHQHHKSSSPASSSSSIINRDGTNGKQSWSDGLFIPDTVFKLSCAVAKPELPYLSESQLVIGSTVWVVDEEDVETIMKIYWQSIHKKVCNGRMKGTVLRHTGNMTLVKFNYNSDENNDSCGQGSFVLTLPRICLSLKEIAPYDNICPSGTHGIMTACYSNLSSRVTRGGATNSNDTSRVEETLRKSVNQQSQEKCDELACSIALMSSSVNKVICENIDASVNRHAVEKPINYYNKCKHCDANTPIERIDKVACCYYESELERYRETKSIENKNCNNTRQENEENFASLYELAENKFYKNMFTDALLTVNKLLQEYDLIDELVNTLLEEREEEDKQEKEKDKLEFHQECEESKNETNEHYVKTMSAKNLWITLLLRSRIYLFLENFTNALTDAQRCARLFSRNPLSHLHLARAFSGVGDFNSAAESLADAKMFADVDLLTLINDVDEVNEYMLATQKYITQHNSSLLVRLDAYYRKRLCPSQLFRAKDKMFYLDKPIISLTSFFLEPPAHRCATCYAPLQEANIRTNNNNNNNNNNSNKNINNSICKNETFERHRNELASVKNAEEHIREMPDNATDKHNAEQNEREQIKEELLGNRVVCVNTEYTNAKVTITHQATRNKEKNVDNNYESDTITAVTASAPTNNKFINITTEENNLNESVNANTRNKKKISLTESTSHNNEEFDEKNFCSVLCERKGQRLFAILNKHRDGLTRARELIYSKAAVTIDLYPLEMGAMTIHLFFLIIAECSANSQFKRLSLSEKEQRLKYILKELNLYPMVTEIISSRLRDEISAVYDALTIYFTVEEKALYSIELFTYVYRYVRAYFVSVEVQEERSLPEVTTAHDNNNKSNNNYNYSSKDEISNNNTNDTQERANEPLSNSGFTENVLFGNKEMSNFVLPLIDENGSKQDKLTIFCVPTLIGGIERASVTSCFGSGHVEIRNLSTLTTLSRSQLNTSEKINTTIESNTNTMTNNNKSNYNSGGDCKNKLDDMICFASAPPNCEIHAWFEDKDEGNCECIDKKYNRNSEDYDLPWNKECEGENTKELLLNESQHAITCTTSKNESWQSTFDGNNAANCLYKIESAKTLNKQISSNNNNDNNNNIDNDSNNKIGDSGKEIVNTSTEQLTAAHAHVSSEEKVRIVGSNNKLCLELMATRNVNKRDKLLLPPFVLDLSELERYVEEKKKIITTRR